MKLEVIFLRHNRFTNMGLSVFVVMTPSTSTLCISSFPPIAAPQLQAIFRFELLSLAVSLAEFLAHKPSPPLSVMWQPLTTTSAACAARTPSAAFFWRVQPSASILDPSPKAYTPYRPFVAAVHFSSTARAPLNLSLIHISEPTRPY